MFFQLGLLAGSLAVAFWTTTMAKKNARLVLDNADLKTRIKDLNAANISLARQNEEHSDVSNEFQNAQKEITRLTVHNRQLEVSAHRQLADNGKLSASNVEINAMYLKAMKSLSESAVRQVSYDSDLRSFKVANESLMASIATYQEHVGRLETENATLREKESAQQAVMTPGEIVAAIKQYIEHGKDLPSPSKKPFSHSKGTRWSMEDILISEGIDVTLAKGWEDISRVTGKTQKWDYWFKSPGGIRVRGIKQFKSAVRRTGILKKEMEASKYNISN